MKDVTDKSTYSLLPLSRGGQRPGAGRKKLDSDQRKESVVMRIPADRVDAVRRLLTSPPQLLEVITDDQAVEVVEALHQYYFARNGGKPYGYEFICWFRELLVMCRVRF